MKFYIYILSCHTYNSFGITQIARRQPKTVGIIRSSNDDSCYFGLWHQAEYSCASVSAFGIASLLLHCTVFNHTVVQSVLQCLQTGTQDVVQGRGGLVCLCDSNV